MFYAFLEKSCYRYAWGERIPADDKAHPNPNKDYAGPDSFTFKANDGIIDGSIGKVNINVKK